MSEEQHPKEDQYVAACGCLVYERVSRLMEERGEFEKSLKRQARRDALKLQREKDLATFNAVDKTTQKKPEKENLISDAKEELLWDAKRKVEATYLKEMSDLDYKTFLATRLRRKEDHAMALARDKVGDARDLGLRGIELAREEILKEKERKEGAE